MSGVVLVLQDTTKEQLFYFQFVHWEMYPYFLTNNDIAFYSIHP